MPEGDSIFRAARVLNQALAGQSVIRFEGRTAPLTRGAIAADPAGAAITSVEARGKHLLMHFSNGRVLRSHMRMHGSWHLYRPGEKWRAASSSIRAVIETAAWTAIAVDVPVAEWVRESDLAQHAPIARLGPDLLSPQFDIDAAFDRLKSMGDLAIAESLLDQSVMAGIGNVYKSEVLFIGRVSPFTATMAIEDETLRRLIAIGARCAAPQRVAERRDAQHDAQYESA